eukprot:COSAG02_NODE_31_length_50774_cov_1928.118204_38_plen_164_part_00
MAPAGRARAIKTVQSTMIYVYIPALDCTAGRIGRWAPLGVAAHRPRHEVIVAVCTVPSLAPGRPSQSSHGCGRGVIAAGADIGNGGPHIADDGEHAFTLAAKTNDRRAADLVQRSGPRDRTKNVVPCISGSRASLPHSLTRRMLREQPCRTPSTSTIPTAMVC